MKCFPDNLSRQQTLWLLVHGLFAGYLAAGLAHIAIWEIRDSHRFSDPRLIFAAVGNTAAMLAGVLIMILCAWRMRKPFAILRMRFPPTSLVVVEVIVIFLVGSFILDCGEFATRLLMIAVPLNLALIGFQHRLPAKPPEPDPGPS